MKEIDKNVQLYIWATITTQFHLSDNNRVMLASAHNMKLNCQSLAKFNVKLSTKYLYVTLIAAIVRRPDVIVFYVDIIFRWYLIYLKLQGSIAIDINSTFLYTCDIQMHLADIEKSLALCYVDYFCNFGIAVRK